MASVWILQPRPRPQARLRLFCLPYAGGGTAAYRSWAERLPTWVELLPVQPPGRENRLAEPAHRRVGTLVPAMAEGLLPWLDRPFAFFGHSMGALLSFELTRHLGREHGLAPTHLFASAHRAPQLPDRKAPAHSLPDAGFLAELRRLQGTPQGVLEHKELLDLLLPTLRADFELCETYRYQPGPPLDLPVTVFGGLGDTHLPREDLEAWRKVTAGPFSIHWLPGDHFFLHTERDPLLHLVVRALTPVASNTYGMEPCS